MMIQAVDAFLAFSFYTNAATVLDVSPPKEGNLKSLASIRFISMTWVASGHTLFENTFSGASVLSAHETKLFMVISLQTPSSQYSPCGILCSRLRS